MKNLYSELKKVLADSVKICTALFKVMIPIIIVVKIVKELGLIPYLAIPLEPVMTLVGLPAELGLVWATAILNTTYAALIVFADLAGDLDLTGAQATVLAVMILIAHSIPIEVKIAKATGTRPLFQILFRLGSAIAYGFILSRIFTTFGLYKEPATMLLHPPEAVDESLATWLMGEAQNLLMIFVFVIVLLIFLRILEKIRVTHLIYKILAPVLNLMGIGQKASSLTVIGLTLGIGYGGGLLIQEASSGRLPGRDVFHSLTFLGLCHAVFEDSFLLLLIGAKFSGVFWGRIIFTVLAIALLVRLTRSLSEKRFEAHFWARPKAE